VDQTKNYSASFLRAIDKTLGWEGGYSNDPDDPGGETNWGISKRWHPDLDIKNLLRDGAIAIYWDEDWRPMRLDELRDPRLAAKVFDTVVNQDRRIAPGALQGALILLGCNLQLDYKIGPVTIAAANSYRYPEALLEVFTVLRGMAYLLGGVNIEEVIAMIRERKARLQKNIRGWLKRLELGALALLLALALNACAAMQPSIPDLIINEPLTDTAIVNYGKKLFIFYNSRAGKAKVLGTSAGIVLSALATGAQAAANAGASANSVSLVGSIARFITDALGITEPIERANAYDDGATDTIQALADYMDATIPDGQAQALVPMGGYTKAGSALLSKFGAVIRVTNAQLKNARPAQADLQIIAAKIETVVKASVDRAAAEKAAADAKKKEKPAPPSPAPQPPNPSGVGALWSTGATPRGEPPLLSGPAPETAR